MRPCSRAQGRRGPEVRVCLSFELPGGVNTDLIVGSLLMDLLREITIAGVPAHGISLDIAEYHPHRHD